MNQEDCRLESYDFDLPPELIAQQPADQRDSSRLLLLSRSQGTINHNLFPEILELIPAES